MTPSSISVALTPSELSQAAHVGAIRQITSIRDGRPDRGFDGSQGWTKHIEGACGEIGFAKVFGFYWGGVVGGFKQPGGDSITGVEVRCRSRHDYELLVRRDSRDEDYYMLLTGQNGTYQMRGFLRAGDCKRPEWMKTHGGREAAYFVPHSALRDPRKIMDVI